MGKWAEADRTGACFNCNEEVGRDNLVSYNCWPVCPQCADEMEMDNEEEDI